MRPLSLLQLLSQGEGIHVAAGEVVWLGRKLAGHFACELLPAVVSGLVPAALLSSTTQTIAALRQSLLYDC